MIKIKNINIDSFKLLSNTELNLEGRAGIVSLQGINLDNPNFSGNSVGKSTLVNVILQGLFMKNIQGDSIERLSNAYTKEKPSITITLEKESVEYTIVNNYKDGICKVYKEGVLLDFVRKKDIKDEIEEILGISYFIFSQLIYISPNNPSLFSSVSNDAQNKFIQSLLNIEFIQDINKKSSADLKSFRGEVTLKVKELNLLQQQVESLTKQINLVPVFEDIDYSEEINSMAADISRKEDYQIILKKNYDKAKKELEAENKREIEIKSEIKHLEIALNKELDLIAKGACPTCGQSTTKLTIKTDKSLLKNLKESHTESFEKVLAKKAELRTIEDELAEVSSEITIARNTLNGLKHKKEEQIKAEKHISLKTSLEEQRTEAITNLIEAQSKLSQLEDKVYILELITQCTSSKGFIKERISLFLQLFNQELQELGKDLLGSNYLIEITRNKTLGYELTVNDGEIVLNYNSLSSGYKSRLDLVIALALNSAIKLLTGIDINILFLDEILSAVDSVGIESISKLLNKIKHRFPEKIIFVVSHNQILKEVSYTLTITRQNDASKLKWESD